MTRVALLTSLSAACAAASADPGRRHVEPAPAVVAPALPALVIDEVGAAGAPDWFEVVNTTHQLIELADFVYVDVAGDLDRARSFPDRTLGPGERHVQYVDTAIDGFWLGA